MSVIRRLWNVGKGRFQIARRGSEIRGEADLDAELARERKPARAAAKPPPTAAPEPEPATPEPEVDPYDPAAPDRKRTL